MLPLLTVCWWGASLLGGCAAGRIVGPEGDVQLRTAWRLDDAEAPGLASAVVLSSGELPCDVPSTGDAAEVARWRADAATALCREGSEHLVIRLARAESAGWEGHFEGRSDGASVGDTSSEHPRLAQASWAFVEEARLSGIDGLVLQYEPAVVDSDFRVGDDGSVDLDHADLDDFSGHFDFPSIERHGSFHARRCGGALSAWLQSAPTLPCATLW